MASQIQIRRDTAANWTSTNPTLAEGELGLETDTRKLKIGDGITAWNDLEYYVNPSEGGTVYERKSETFYAPSYISYLAFAPQGSLETDAVWTITKRVGSADGTIISNVQYLLKKWSERNLL